MANNTSPASMDFEQATARLGEFMKDALKETQVDFLDSPMDFIRSNYGNELKVVMDSINAQYTRPMTLEAMVKKIC
jgi:hypothetical protein